MVQIMDGDLGMLSQQGACFCRQPGPGDDQGAQFEAGQQLRLCVTLCSFSYFNELESLADDNQTILTIPGEVMNRPVAYLVESIPLDLVDLRPPEGVVETKTALKQLVDGAQKTIDVTAVYWSLLTDDDDMAGLSEERLDELGAGYGRTLFESLENAARRGVRIRILQSPGFSEEPQPQESAHLAARFPDRVQVRQVDLLPWFGGGIMHHKSWIVDGRSLYLGSANMDWRSLTQVKELGVIVENQLAIAADAARQFGAWWQLAAMEPRTAEIVDATAQRVRLVPDWSDLVVDDDRFPFPFSATAYNQDNPLPLIAGGQPGTVYLTASPPELGNDGRTDDLTGLLHTIRTAEIAICLSVMNFLPVGWLDEQMFHWPALTDALLRAAITRGVHVRLLISHWPYTVPATWPFLGALRDWARAGQGQIEVKQMILPGSNETEGDARRFPGHSRVNHPKFIVTDRRLNVGTSNMVWGYFTHTIGGSFNTDHPALIRQAQAIFDRDWESVFAQPLAQGGKRT